MPTRRTPLRRGERARRISPLAEAAWRSCDYHGLHKALGLGPHETSPLPHEVTALGCYQGEPPEWMSLEQWPDWYQAVELQRQFLDAFGLPDTDALQREYEGNLTDARERVAYAEKSANNDLPAAQEAMAWREHLLEKLDAA